MESQNQQEQKFALISTYRKITVSFFAIQTIYSLAFFFGTLTRIYVLPSKFDNDYLSLKIALADESTLEYRANSSFQNTWRLLDTFVYHNWMDQQGFFFTFLIGFFTVRALSKSVSTLKILDLITVLIYGYLLPIYVGPFSKDFIFSLVIMLLVTNRYKPTLFVLSIIVFSLISVQIRLAYLPLGILAIILFFAIKKVGKRGLTISKIIVLFLATLLSSLYFASRVFEIPINRYREYLNSNRIGSIEAISAIPNFTSLPFPTADFIADSLASFFVLILPIYLYPISMNYIITSLFITLILTKYLFTIRKIAISASSNANSTLILLPLFFLFIAAVAEPDYGSFLRHLTPFLPLIYLATITLRDQQLYTSIKKRG